MTTETALLKPRGVRSNPG